MHSLSTKAVVGLACVAVVLAAFGDFTGKDWQSHDAKTKASRLWDAVTADKESGSWPSKLSLGGLFIEDMNTSMDQVGDELPYQYLGTTRREKLIHSVGSVARIRFVPAKDTPYTGIFAGGQGFTRCSLAKDPSGGEYTPGCGYKFVRSAVKSANFVAMYALTGQESKNFMKNDFTNHVPDLGSSAPASLKLLAAKFKTASCWPTMVGLSDMAKFGTDGKEVSKPNFPYNVVLKPVDSVRNAFSDENDKSHVDQLNSFGKDGSFSDFWTVYARAAPKADLVNIGTIQIYDRFVSSRFGDTEMFFQHQRIEDDFKIHPDWQPSDHCSALRH